MLKFLKWTLFIWVTVSVMTIIHEGAHYAACRYYGIVPTKVLIGPYPGIGGLTIKTPATFFFVGWFPDGGATYFSGNAAAALGPQKRLLIHAAGVLTHLLALLILPLMAFGGKRSTPWRILNGLPLKLLASLRGIVCFFFGFLYVPRLDPKPDDASWSYKDFAMFWAALSFCLNFFPMRGIDGANDGYLFTQDFSLAYGMHARSLALCYTVMLSALFIWSVITLRYAMRNLAIHCMAQEVERAEKIVRLLQERAGADAGIPTSPASIPHARPSEERFRGDMKDGLPPNPPLSS